MSRRGASNDERDPCLTQNHGYFVDRAELAAHLEAHKGQPQEVSYSPFINYNIMDANIANMDSGVHAFPITP